MNTRRLWQDIMWYRGHDRMPVVHWRGWEETEKRWHREGLPRDVDQHQFFKTVPMWHGVGADVGLFPPFREEVLEETGEYRILRTREGIIQKEWKNRSNIPHYLDFQLKSGRDWDRYKKRLQPDERRIDPQLDEKIRQAESSGFPIVFTVASLMGWIRNWMGVENLVYLMYDEPDAFVDMVDTLSDLSCWAIEQVVPRMQAPPDMGLGWEDICGRSGPFVSPALFRKYVAPGYRKIRNALEKHGVRILGIDSDGDVSALVGPWLEAGVNLQFPIEIGTWNADPMAFRKKYGRELRIIGGLNKLALEKGPAEIDAEIARRLPLMKEGGFVVMPDHLITPGVSLENYRYYLDRIRNLRF